ncbi:hypothetical protein [Candidatus Foliamicus sp.]
MKKIALLCASLLVFSGAGAAEPLQWDASRYSQEVTQCDRLAAHADDPFAVSPGIAQSSMDFDGATAACEEAVAADPENPRLRYQLARVYGYSGQGKKAYPHREAAIAADYPQALFVNGYLHFLGINEAPQDVCRAAALMRRAAQYGRLAGQIGFTRYALDGEFDGCDTPIDPREMSGFLDAAADANSGYYLSMLIAMLRKEVGQAWPEGEQQ